jgi:hypothetical protein
MTEAQMEPERNSCRRRRAILAACALPVLALMLVGCGAGGKRSPSSAGGGTASASPSLATLERRMMRLELQEVRVSFHEALGVSPEFTGGGRRHVLSRSWGVAEADLHSRVARLSAVEDGDHIKGRFVDGILYMSPRWLAKKDGGRPWVRIGAPKSGAKPNLGPRLLLDGGPTFSGLRKTLARAISVRDDGEARVDGRSATRFTAKLSAPSRAITHRRSHRLPESRDLEVFLTASGLPIETIGKVGNGFTLLTTVSRLASVSSLTVRPPERRLTIARRLMQRIERDRIALHRHKGRPKILVIKG